MTVGKASALTAAFIGVFAIGVAVGPSVKEKFSHGTGSAVAQPVATVATPEVAPDATPKTARVPRARAAAPQPKVVEKAAGGGSLASSALPASEPRLQERLKPVLNRGARMEVAAE